MSEVRKKRTFTDYISKKIIEIVGQGRKISELDKKKLDYWIQMIYLNVTKVVIMLIVGIILNVLMEVIVLWFFFAMLKLNAFGMHSKSSLSCTISSVIIFDGGALISKYINFSSFVIYIIFIIAFIIFIVYAPADTESRPIVGEKVREKFKIRTIITAISLFTVVMVLGIDQIKILLAFSALAEAISILPITYKIFKRRYGNYEYYKKGNK